MGNYFGNIRDGDPQVFLTAELLLILPWTGIGELRRSLLKLTILHHSHRTCLNPRTRYYAHSGAPLKPSPDVFLQNPATSDHGHHGTSASKSELAKMVWRNINAVIENRLYLGTIEAAISPRTLSDRHITHIVSVGSEPIPADNPASGIRHLRIQVEDVDYADLLIHLPGACRFIDDALKSNGVVLVHCVQGLSRSATVVAAYMMYSRHIEASEAMEIVRRAREQVWIIPGFQEQLVLFGLCRYAPRRAREFMSAGARRLITP
ncbi:Dual specificity protein phosphatase 1B [Grifola frondosa]|uniref:Dual specificity protein phosphatase 1B n=1 Tax=Grifola frondosa TaxID=5627 RepID=A0A1C7MI01_GRIFR|nr:Dual specificity protein phosphatase 1B [Grifola frondosa]